MDAFDDHAAPPERGSDAVTVSTTERHFPSPERDLYAPPCSNAEGVDAELISTATVYGSVESPEIDMYGGEDEEMHAATMTTEFENAESPEFDSEEELSPEEAAAESPENDMFEGEDPEFRATPRECAALQRLENLMSGAREAAAGNYPNVNAESPVVFIYGGADDDDSPPVEIEDEKDESPEFVIRDGDNPTPESLAVKLSRRSPERALHAPIKTTSLPPANVITTDEASDFVNFESVLSPARGRCVNFESVLSPARGRFVIFESVLSQALASNVEEGVNLFLEETEDGTAARGRCFNFDTVLSPARASKLKAEEGGGLSSEETEEGTTAAPGTHLLSNTARIVPGTEAVGEEATAETFERGAYEEAVPPTIQSPAKKKGEKHSPLPERGSFSIPAEGASHEEYMEVWLRIDATAAGEELMRLLQEDVPSETTERSVVSDGSHAPPSICRRSSPLMTMNSNEESGSFSDGNATAIVTVDMTGELPMLVTDPQNTVGDGMDGVDCEWSDSAFACLYEEDEEVERGDGEVLLPHNGQHEASPKD